MADDAVRTRTHDAWSPSHDARFRFAQSGADRVSGRQSTRNSEHTTVRGESTGNRIRLVRTLIIGLVLTVITIAAGELTFQHVIAPNLAISTVRVDGDVVLSREQLLEATGLSGRVLYMHVDTREIEHRLSSIPAVRNAHVTRVFPDTLIIDLQGRTPLFVVDVATETGVIPVAGDQDGVLFRDAHAGDLTLPIISGIQFRNFSFGDALPEEINVLFQDLTVLRREHPDLFNLISEIRLVPVGRRFETVLYPLNAAIPVRLDARARPETYEQALRIISYVRAEYGEENVAEIDLRGRDVVYTLRGEGDSWR